MAKLPFVINDGKWHHICITWTTRDGVWEAYQDGTQGGHGENLAPYHPIKPQGVLVLGQEQVLPGTRGRDQGAVCCRGRRGGRGGRREEVEREALSPGRQPREAAAQLWAKSLLCVGLLGNAGCPGSAPHS